MDDLCHFSPNNSEKINVDHFAASLATYRFDAFLLRASHWCFLCRNPSASNRLSAKPSADAEVVAAPASPLSSRALGALSADLRLCGASVTSSCAGGEDSSCTCCSTCSTISSASCLWLDNIITNNHEHEYWILMIQAALVGLLVLPSPRLLACDWTILQWIIMSMNINDSSCTWFKLSMEYELERSGANNALSPPNSRCCTTQTPMVEKQNGSCYTLRDKPGTIWFDFCFWREFYNLEEKFII